MPRAATSVATSTSIVPARNRRSAFSRAICGRSPWIAVAGETPFGQVVGDPLGGPLGPAEDHHPLAVLGLQDAGDHLGLVQIMGLVDELRRGRDRRGLVTGLRADVHRVPEVPAGQVDDGRRHGGREQHRLAQLGGLGQDALDVGQESEIEHLVGLVEDEHLDVAEVEHPAVGQIQQSARGADHDVDAVRELVELMLVADPAVDGEHAGPPASRRRAEVLADLAGQLAGRRDD